MKMRQPMAFTASRETQRPRSNRWLLIPLCLAVLVCSSLFYYQFSSRGTAAPDGVFQGLVVWLYGLLGFPAAFSLSLLFVCWTSIWFFLGEAKEPLARTWRLLAFALALAVLSNLRQEPGVQPPPEAGDLGLYIALNLRSVFGVTFSTILMVPVTTAALLLATDFFFYRYFEGMQRPNAAPGTKQPKPSPSAPGAAKGRLSQAAVGVVSDEEGVESEATEVLMSLSEAVGSAAVTPQADESERALAQRSAGFDVEDLIAAVEGSGSTDASAATAGPREEGVEDAGLASVEVDMDAGEAAGLVPQGDASEAEAVEAEAAESLGEPEEEGEDAFALSVADDELAELAASAVEAVEAEGDIEMGPEVGAQTGAESVVGESPEGPSEAVADVVPDEEGKDVHRGSGELPFGALLEASPDPQEQAADEPADEPSTDELPVEEPTAEEPSGGDHTGASPGEQPVSAQLPEVLIPRPEPDPSLAEGDAADAALPEEPATSDPLLDEAIALVRQSGRASVNGLFRKLGVDRATARELLESMRELGVIQMEAGAQQGTVV